MGQGRFKGIENRHLLGNSARGNRSRQGAAGRLALRERASLQDVRKATTHYDSTTFMVAPCQLLRRDAPRIGAAPRTGIRGPQPTDSCRATFSSTTKRASLARA
jgi:hypothetical protein